MLMRTNRLVNYFELKASAGTALAFARSNWKEITINDAQRKDFDYYHKMLKASFEQIYNVLKPGRWWTVTFHNTDIKIYNSIIKAVVLAGFDLEKVIYQSPQDPHWNPRAQTYM